MYEIDLEKEAKTIEEGFQRILDAWDSDKKDEESIKLVRKAFDIAVEAHSDMRRKSGEPYIYHPIEVAIITAKELGLGKTSIICALLHDVVEDTDYTLDEFEALFGDKVANIIDGLTKIQNITDKSKNTTPQVETFKKIILSFAYDIRVILIKLADRLHNMRTLEFMSREKQIKIASETEFIYSKLAHRLGYFAVKDELEDLSLKYLEPELYEMLYDKIASKKELYHEMINSFIEPISKELTALGMDFEITTRFKTVHSIWRKMIEKKVSFEDIDDLFAVRIVINSDEKNEKFDCWKVYAVVTNFYNPKQDRLRDWISTPKVNGYEALHATVMSNTGNWVEVQIRSKRMDEIAEKGLAAHWKYKDKSANAPDGKLDQWINVMRQIIETQKLDVLDNDSIGFIDDFKNNLFTDEIFVFTPKGELRTLPANSTVLDFAYAVHTELGNTCIAAKVNNSLVSKFTILHSGDQIEILTSKNQKPSEDWLEKVQTQRAKTRIRAALKNDKKGNYDKGLNILKGWLDKLNKEINDKILDKILTASGEENLLDLFNNIAINKIGFENIKRYLKFQEKSKWYSTIFPFGRNKDNEKTINEIVKKNAKNLLLDKDISNLSYTLCDFCNPIPGDKVIGVTDEKENMIIHRTNCPNAINFASKHGNKIFKAKWRKEDLQVGFLTRIEITGLDRKGILANITNIFITDYKINIREMKMEAKDGIFKGTFSIYISDSQTLNDLIEAVKKIDGVQSVIRVNRPEDKVNRSDTNL